MTIHNKLSVDNKSLIIKIHGDFDFKLISSFRHAYIDISDAVSKLIIDLRDTVTIDSSSFGMLLNMRDYLKDKNIDVSIINCNAEIMSFFNVVNFNKLFKIS